MNVVDVDGKEFTSMIKDLEKESGGGGWDREV